MKTRLDKIASSTKNISLNKTVALSGKVTAVLGTIIAVRALAEKKVYSHLELLNGRTVKVRRNDVIAGVLGERKAVKGFVGFVPKRIRKGDTLHLLNLGGVIGKCTSFAPDLGKPLPVRVLGSVLVNGKPANIKNNSLKWRSSIKKSAPIVLVAGTCMNSGKTSACVEIIKGLCRKKKRIVAAKVAGVSCEKDTIKMHCSGALAAFNFNDAGLPSTTNPSEVLPVAKGIIFELNKLEPDLIVLELGDGLIGGYGVEKLLQDKEIKKLSKALVVCANDNVAAWGAKELLKKMNWKIDLFSGPATDNSLGSGFIEKKLKTSAANALTEPKKLAKIIEKKVFGKK